MDKRTKQPLENQNNLNLSRINVRDQRVFTILYDEYIMKLIYYACTIVKDQEIAQNLVHDAFIAFWNAANTFEHTGQLNAFLFVCTRNKCFDYLKSPRLTETAMDETILDENSPSSGNYILNDIIEAETIYEIFEAIKALPTQQRKVMLLTFKDGLSPEIIAGLLNMAPQTVRNNKNIALEKLQKQFPAKAVLLLWLLSEIGNKSR